MSNFLGNLHFLFVLSDNFTCPCLWVGTSLGSVLVIVMNLPQAGEQRLTQPVIVSPSGMFLTDPILKLLIETQLGDNCIQNFHLGGISSDIWSEILFYKHVCQT